MFEEGCYPWKPPRLGSNRATRYDARRGSAKTLLNGGLAATSLSTGPRLDRQLASVARGLMFRHQVNPTTKPSSRRIKRLIGRLPDVLVNKPKVQEAKPRDGLGRLAAFSRICSLVCLIRRRARDRSDLVTLCAAS